jgi:sugar (pentulose or hexulose) kinase
MLNSGLQPLWLRKEKPEVFARVRHILHFPQYLSYLLTGKIYSEHTSIGCHTALWDFDNMCYHPWTAGLGIELPPPSPVTVSETVTIGGKEIRVGIGIHDSSASLAPYFKPGSGKFLLLSTGTWLISMNPFNPEHLTAKQLDNDCLCYLSINGKPVKSSRLFLGNMHDTGSRMISSHFAIPEDFYRKISPDWKLFNQMRSKYSGKSVFMKPSPDSRTFRDKVDMYEFPSYEEAYHQLMNELGNLTIEAVRYIIPEVDESEIIYVTGGFSKNRLFLNTIRDAFPEKSLYTSDISNGSALGAAITVEGNVPALNLGLTECRI